MFIPLSAVDLIYLTRPITSRPTRRREAYGLLLEDARAAAGFGAGPEARNTSCRCANDAGIKRAVALRRRGALDERLIEQVDVQEAERNCAAADRPDAVDTYDPRIVDEEKQRILGAIDQKIAGKEIAESTAPEPATGQIIDLMEALRASLGGKKAPAGRAPAATAAEPASTPTEPAEATPRKGPKRAAPAQPAAAPARARARK
jgi:DNA end-binding protein Ku